MAEASADAPAGPTARAANRAAIRADAAAPAEAKAAAPSARSAPAARSLSTGPAQDLMARATVRSPLRGLRDTMQAAPAGWQWLGPGGTARQVLDDAARAHLARIDQASAGRWRPDPAGPADATLPALRWWQAGVPQGTLHFDADALRLTDAAGRHWRADLPPDVLAALQRP